ncbi:hypothetical protein KC950_04095 [Candidatus Saccharibacteria bacterium]|nr:hypothetical protein [Candidatus Saccharibacteria bacterium]
MKKKYKGILIDESVEDSDSILSEVKIEGQRITSLEGELFRGDVTFFNIVVDESNLWNVLELVAKAIKSPGWYFHLVGNGTLYVVLPGAILFARKNETEVNRIIKVAKNQGIHSEQLNLIQLFDNPYA